MSLLTDQVLSVRGGNQLSLAEVFAGMARGEIKGFSALRPHQRPAWHMFLVQLAALALWKSDQDGPPTDPDSWVAALRTLTPSHDDAPWTLVVGDDRKPAFLQPPVPDQPLKWTPVHTPDALDLLITARNHDLKQEVATSASAEDWIFALVSLQTTEGFGGAGNQGIARMNGGHSSRPMLGLAPASGASDTSIDASAWWARDVSALLTARKTGSAGVLGKQGGPALLWCLEWPEGEELSPADLDPWFIEVCRRVRLAQSEGAIGARRSTSASTRVAAKAHKGNLGDPWVPVDKTGKSLTLGVRGEFDYSRLTDLLFSGDWKVPRLARPDANDDGDMLIVAEALSRGNNKTAGFKSRVIPAPGRAVRAFSSPSTARLAQAQVKEIRAVDSALRYALALAAAHGVWSAIKPSHYALARPASKSLNRAADQAFFPSLWRRLEAATSNEAERTKTKVCFLEDLKLAAERALEATLPTVPCPAIYRTRTAIRARRAFMGKLRSHDDTKAMFAEENTVGS